MCAVDITSICIDHLHLRRQRSIEVELRLLASVRESSDGTHALDEPAPPLVPCVRLFRRYLPFPAAITAGKLNMDFAAYDNDTRLTYA